MEVTAKEQRIADLLDEIPPWRRSFDRWLVFSTVGIADSLLRHWLLLLNLANGLILAGAIAVPIMRAAGWEGLGSLVFSSYRLICQQNPDHSYYLLGYQLAMDQRMLAIYGATLLAGIIFVPMRGRLRPLWLCGYLLLTLPMAVDGFTQLFGWRHSNWELRTLTGTMFGIATVWFAYPYLERCARPTTGQPRESRAPFGDSGGAADPQL